MRIGIVCYPTYGGSGVVATELGRVLARRGHLIHIIASSRPFRMLNEYSENIYYHEVDTYEYPVLGSNLYTLTLANKIAEVTLDERLDLIHVHYAIPHAISASLAMDMLAGVGKQVPVLTTLHGTDITLVGSSPSFLPTARLGIQRSDAVTAVSKWLRDETEKRFRLHADIKVVYNFIDGDVFKQCPECLSRRPRYAEPHEKILVHLSNFRPVKRVTDVIRVFDLVAKKMPAKLLMIGDGPDREPAIQLARQLGLMDRIWFLGKQDFVQKLLPLGDLFLFPSDGESFGLAAAEAMACGCPVVAADRGGVPEVIKHGETGILCPMGDVEAMASEAIALLSAPDRLKAMGDLARRDVMERFDPDKIVGQYEEIYDSLLGHSLNAVAAQ